MDLLAADGTTVIENDDDDGTGNGGDGTIETGLASIIAGRTLTAGGTYFIRVQAFSATGIINPYRLFVSLTNVAATAEVEANDTAATANVANSPALRSGSIGVAADADYYSISANAGDTIFSRLMPIRSATARAPTWSLSSAIRPTPSCCRWIPRSREASRIQPPKARTTRSTPRALTS